MSGSFRKPVNRRQMNPLAVAVVGATIGASATVISPVISHHVEQGSKICDWPDKRLVAIENLVEAVPKLKQLRGFLASDADRSCACYKSALAEVQELEKEIADDEQAAKRDKARIPIEQPRYDPQLDHGLSSQSPQLRVASPAQIVPPPAPSSPILKTEASPVPAAPTSDDTIKSDAAVRDFTALREAPPLVVTRSTIFSDPSKPFEGEVGDRLALQRGFDYELRPPQDTTTTYRIVRGTLTVDLEGKPYLSCKRGNEFRLYWKNAADFWTRTKDQKAELTVVDQQPGKHLGVSACEDALG